MGVDKMRHAFVILAHKDVSHLSNLIQQLSPHYDLYIHLDKRMDKNDKKHIYEYQNDRVSVFSWRHVRWGGIQIVKTEMQLVRIALKTHRYDYIHLISGQDFPIKSIPEINAWFNHNKGTQFMEFHRLPVDKWEKGTYARFQYFRLLDWFDYSKESAKKIVDWVTDFQIKHGIRRRIPDQYPYLYGGSNWMSLTYDCWEYITRKDKRSNRFLNRLRFTFASDEVFFHTKVMNSPFKNKVVNNNLRLIKWKGDAVKKLNQTDLWEILISNSLFARKFDSLFSKRLLEAVSEFENERERKSFNLKFANKLLRLIEILNVETVCDITSGIGLYVKFFQNAGIRAYGIDKDSSACRLSRMVFCDGYNCQPVDLFSPFALEKPMDLIIAHTINHDAKAYNNTWYENIARNSSRYLLLRFSISNDEGPEDVAPELQIINRLNKVGFRHNETMSKTLAYDMDKDYRRLYLFEKQLYSM